MRAALKRIVEDTDSVPGRVFDAAVQLLVVFSVVTFSIETLPGLSASTLSALRVAEVVVVGVFTVEYLLRFLVADRPLGFVFSFWGLIDLVAILPFYLALGIDLRSIRSFRLLRVFRLFKLARYSRAVRRYARAFRATSAELVLFGAFAVILLYLSGVGIYYFEREAQPEEFASVFHSLWWALATLTTVGYGDVYPVTVGGKVFTFVVLVLGLGVVAVPSGLLASALSLTREEDARDGAAEGKASSTSTA